MDGVITTDGDAFLYGARQVRHFASSLATPTTPSILHVIWLHHPSLVTPHMLHLGLQERVSNRAVLRDV